MEQCWNDNYDYLDSAEVARKWFEELRQDKSHTTLLTQTNLAEEFEHAYVDTEFASSELFLARCERSLADVQKMMGRDYFVQCAKSQKEYGEPMRVDSLKLMALDSILDVVFTLNRTLQSKRDKIARDMEDRFEHTSPDIFPM